MKTFLTLSLLFCLTVSKAQNLLDMSSWTIGTGSAGSFDANGQQSESERLWGIGPNGKQAILWRSIPDGNSDADGGWNHNYIAVDHKSAYRLTVWLKKEGSMDGYSYFGTQNVNTLSNVPNTNPYFWNGDLPELNRWYLLVAYIHGSGDNSTVHLGGMYDGTTGEKVINLTDFKLDVGTTSINHRSYLYYDPTSSDSQYFYAPRMERIDGHEPSLNELLGFIPQQKLLPIADTRSMVTTPNFYSRSFELNFKEGVTLGLPNSYYTVMGLRGWPNDSGGKAHELAFSNDTKSKLWIRSGFDSGWEGWRSFLISNESGNYGINTDSPTDKLDIRGGGINIGVKGDNQYVNVFGAWRTQGSASAGLWDEKMEGEDLAFHYYTGSTWNTYRLSLTPDGFASTGTMNVMGSGDNFIAGNVRIGTTVAHPERLSVNGRIRAHEIKVETANWPDYVFDDDYKNVPLPQLEQFIKLHKHLPDVPSAKVVAENGIELGEMNKLLLKKIEELTLHLIQKDKENIELKKRMDNLEQKLNQFMK